MSLPTGERTDRLRIVHVVPSIDSEASGPSYSVGALNRAILDAGHASCLVATSAEAEKDADGVRFFPRRSVAFRLGRSPEMRDWLRETVSAGGLDVVHNNSLWMMPNVYPSWAVAGSDVPLVVSPRGTFSPWALRRSRHIKFLFWHLLQKQALARTALFHATAESEYRDIRRQGFRQPVAILPNGVDMPELAGEQVKEGARTLLFLGRVHPVKGLDLLLDAWARLEPRHADWRLKIVGPGEPAHVQAVREQAAALGLARVSFEGPLYGAAKTQAYQQADLFVLPTYSENFGMAVAEALAAGCPVVTTKGAPWAGLAAERAGWWVDIGSDPLEAALQDAMTRSPEDLAALGGRGRAWMQRDFSWDHIATRMVAAYRWVREGGAAPDWVRLD